MDKVLIVDDDLRFLEILKDGLRKYEGQFKVLTAEDGEQAIDVLERERISVLVTDLDMPRKCGLELLAYMTRHHSTTPCIAMTGHFSITGHFRRDNGERAVREGALLCIEKPLNVNKLAGTIIAALDRLDEGDSMAGVSVNDYVHLVQMERKTCLLEVSCGDKRKGFLYFDEGVLYNAGILYDATSEDLKEEDAVLEMIGWAHVEIRFKPLPKKSAKQPINKNLVSLIEKKG